MRNFANHIQLFIEKNQLLQKGKKYIVALSGGADSVCLLRICSELGYDIEAAHCNFHLRGTESDRDELFCEELCRQYAIPFHRIHFDTKEYATLHKVSIEMAARDLRYKYFEQLRQDISAEAVLVAHHQDDSVETLLINLIRGTGIRGLQGIQPQQQHIIRPLLAVSRIDILEYLAYIHQDYVTDSSNLIDDVQRNKLRLNIIPLLQTINPNATGSIASTAHKVNMALQIYDHAVAESKKKVVSKHDQQELRISIPTLYNEIAHETILFEILKDYGFSSKQVEQIAEIQHFNSGQSWISLSHTLIVDRNEFVVRRNKDSNKLFLKIPEPGNYILENNHKLLVSTETYCQGFAPSKEKFMITVDADKTIFPLILRHCKSGDHFTPFGMCGSKLVSDYLTDLKLNLFDKQDQLVLEDGAGKIVWIVGRRSDNRFRITPQTHNILRIELK
ncbi:tRNA lysidine(34) synthetase TilS [Prevotella sp.]|uniref:tRNA lysidine(34) synthetase TilS n=1 Tax=Prevotella sp. TaxID=59823 RepID=UPI002F944B3C